MQTVILLSLLILVTSAYYVHPNPPARQIENGDVLSEYTYAQIPRHKVLEFKIAVPEGQALVDLSEAEGRPLECHKISVSDDITGEAIEFCNEMSFNTSTSVTVKIHKLSHPIDIVVDSAKTSYDCNERVNRRLMSIPFKLNAAEQECQFLMPHGDLSIAPVANARDGNGKCIRHVEVIQGRHVARMSMSSGKLCLDQPLTVPLFCGTHGLIVTGGVSAPIKAMIKAPSADVAFNRRLWGVASECPL